MLQKTRRIIEDILRVLSISSVTGDTVGIAKCQDEVKKIAMELGFKTELVGKGKVLVVSPKNVTVPAKLGIVVHLDTVPFEEQEWVYNPLGQLYKDRLYGRGIIDDKGPMILAMHAFEELGDEIEESWQVIIGSDEEGDWEDMQAYLAENPVLPKFLVTVDGDGVQNGCRGYMDLRLVFKKETDTNNIRDLFVPGGSNNTLPKTCTMMLSNGRNYLGVGDEVHSSIPHQGHSAITNLATKVRGEVYEEYKGFFDLLRMLDKTYDGNVIGIPYADVSATNVYMDENGLILNLNVRMEKDVDEYTLKSILANLEAKYHCVASRDSYFRPSSVEPDSPEIIAMQNAYEAVIGKKAVVCIARGLGYNAALPNCAIFGPRNQVEDDEEDFCHQANENRSVKDLMDFYEMFKIFVKEVL